MNPADPAPSSPRPSAPMASPARPAASRLTADARRSLALLAGGDLDPAADAAARSLADDCPHCRGHLAGVRGALDALGAWDGEDAGGPLWPAVRDRLPAVCVATAPAEREFGGRLNRYLPAFAVTAATLLVGAFAFGPAGGQLAPVAGWFSGPAQVRPVADDGGERQDVRPVLRDRFGRVVAPPARGPAVRYPR